jgi:hypothetical protein
MLDRVQSNVQGAKDNPMLVKLFLRTGSVGLGCLEDTYTVGGEAILSTANRRKEYKPPGSGRITKFFPRHDSPYEVTAAYPTYELGISDATPNTYVTFCALQLKLYIPNKVNPFPDCELEGPSRVITQSKEKEYMIDRIVDERKSGRGYQYLVQWKGYMEEEKE